MNWPLCTVRREDFPNDQSVSVTVVFRWLGRSLTLEWHRPYSWREAAGWLDRVAAEERWLEEYLDRVERKS